LKIIVVRGAFPVHVPDVVGRLFNDAENQLRAAGFTQIEVQQSPKDDQKPKDTVLEQTPAAGTGLETAANTKVVLVVSKGPALAMPNLEGQNCHTASEQLKAMGVNVSTPGVADLFRPAYHVQAQGVKEGDPLTPGQTVELTCAPGP
jgi:serine/threonine-protein kinase